MFDITLITMGKLKEKFYLSAAEEYAKRMKLYCNFHLIELPEYKLPENPSSAEIFNVGFGEAEIFDIIYDLLKTCGNGKAATIGHRAEKHIEICYGIAHITCEYAVCHGHLIKVHKHC